MLCWPVFVRFEILVKLIEAIINPILFFLDFRGSRLDQFNYLVFLTEYIILNILHYLGLLITQRFELNLFHIY